MPQPEPVLDVADLLIDPGDPRPLLAERLHDHRRQAFRHPLQGQGHASPHPSPPLRHHLAVLGQQPAQTVDLRGTELHELLAHAMQRQNCLLFLALDRNRPDARLLHCRPDRAGVVRIVLVAADEGPHHLRR